MSVSPEGLVFEAWQALFRKIQVYIEEVGSEEYRIKMKKMEKQILLLCASISPWSSYFATYLLALQGQAGSRDFAYGALGMHGLFGHLINTYVA
jgi:hypothetical protein